MSVGSVCMAWASFATASAVASASLRSLRSVSAVSLFSRWESVYHHEGCAPFFLYGVEPSDGAVIVLSE
jgi:hypothetical protein